MGQLVLNVTPTKLQTLVITPDALEEAVLKSVPNYRLMDRLVLHVNLTKFQTQMITPDVFNPTALKVNHQQLTAFAKVQVHFSMN